MQAVLRTIPACQALQKKLTPDHEEVLSVAAADHRLAGRALQGDLARVADAAGLARWESHLGEVTKTTVSISEGTH